MRFDTIVAPITGNPPAAVAWVRLSGEDAWRIAAAVFRPWPEPVEPRRATYGHFPNGDDGLALPFSAGHSYTGEECVELSLHGSRASIQSVVDACLAAGARIADPGEFTQRAFLNGRIDLTQAEAVRDLIEAQTDVQLRQATRNRYGALRREVEAIRDIIVGQLAAVEASVDFSEEIGDFDRETLLRHCRDLGGRLQELHSAAKMSRIIREGYRIAIVGPPNSGKSSLFNRLLGTSRSIVTPIPGTTRDYIEERIEFDGVGVVLIDTAGLRPTDDVVESMGIELSRKAAQGADEIWFVYDATTKMTVDEIRKAEALQWKFRPLANKSDLVPGEDIGGQAGAGLPISAKTGYQIQLLVDDVRRAVLDHLPPIPVNERQYLVLSDALSTLADLESTLKHDSPDDLLSVLLRDLADHLGRITGQTAEADMIERIFHDFCVGK